MEYVIDTHALHWFLQESEQLSRKAKDAINNATRVYIPAIVLLEAFFVAKKSNKLNIFRDFLETIPNEKFTVFPLELDIVKESVSVRTDLEIHDLIIVATAKVLNIPIITKDSKITKTYKKTIW